MIHVPLHARQRFVERIDPTLSLDQAAEEIRRAENACRAAVAFGASVVKTGRAKLILDGMAVVTVLPRNWVDHSDLRAF